MSADLSQRVYVGRLSTSTRQQDIEDAFSRFGGIERVDLKNGYGEDAAACATRRRPLAVGG